MKIIYTPPPPKIERQPTVSADDFRLGTIVEMPDGSQWKVDWDDQDKRHRWRATSSGRRGE